MFCLTTEQNNIIVILQLSVSNCNFSILAFSYSVILLSSPFHTLYPTTILTLRSSSTVCICFPTLAFSLRFCVLMYGNIGVLDYKLKNIMYTYRTVRVIHGFCIIWMLHVCPLYVYRKLCVYVYFSLVSNLSNVIWR